MGHPSRKNVGFFLAKKTCRFMFQPEFLASVYSPSPSLFSPSGNSASGRDRDRHGHWQETHTPDGHSPSSFSSPKTQLAPPFHADGRYVFSSPKPFLHLPHVSLLHLHHTAGSVRRGAAAPGSLRPPRRRLLERPAVWMGDPSAKPSKQPWRFSSLEVLHMSTITSPTLRGTHTPLDRFDVRSRIPYLHAMCLIMKQCNSEAT